MITLGFKPQYIFDTAFNTNIAGGGKSRVQHLTFPVRCCPMSYSELRVEERTTIQIGHAQGFSLRRIARLINRSPSTISRELRRNRDACGGYSARVAQQQMQARRQVCRPMRKLLPGSERFELVAHIQPYQPTHRTALAHNQGHR